MILIFLTLLITVILLLLFTKYLKVKVVFDTYKADLNMTLSWLHSFFRALVTIEDTKPMLTLYLLNKRLFKRKLTTGKRKRSGIELIKLIESRDIHVNAYYGFRDPFTTGITCGVINVVSQFIKVDSLRQMPDFTTVNDYIHLDASAKVNLGSTLINYFNSNNKLKKVKTT